MAHHCDDRRTRLQVPLVIFASEQFVFHIRFRDALDGLSGDSPDIATVVRFAEKLIFDGAQPEPERRMRAASFLLPAARRNAEPDSRSRFPRRLSNPLHRRHGGEAGAARSPSESPEG